MPIIASPAQQAWIRVPPPRRNKHKTQATQQEALKGPLAYFSCQPTPTTRKMPLCPKYDLDDGDFDHDNNGGGSGSAGKRRGGAGAKRIVSAPATGGGAGRNRTKNRNRGQDYDDDLGHGDADEQDGQGYANRRSPPSVVRSRPVGVSGPRDAPRTQSAYWSGPTNRSAQPARMHGSGGNAGGARSTASARWANATAPLDLG